MLHFTLISLQQFVKGCGSFATEMADAILNSLTNGRHMKFMESIKKDEEKKISGVQVYVHTLTGLLET